jgi:serine protease Do
MQVKKTTVALSVSALLGCGAVAGWLVPTLVNANTAVAAVVAPAPAQAASIPLGTAPNYRAIVAQNRAAVVSVKVEGTQPVAEANPFGGDSNGDDPFSQFFRQLPVPHGNQPMHGLGSGFIVRPDGLILTNAHVVKDAQHVTVSLADHREFHAKVLGMDPATDVAVLKIESHDLPVVHMGDASQLEVGDYVLAIGAPYGLEETASAGIVSAKARSLPGDQYVPFIQTDVAVNPGNSGGPLFDAHGNVVGINSQIYSNTGGFQGVAFAIPIDVAQRVQEQIVTNGKVQHAKLGVTIQPVDQSLAGSFKLDSPRGALVSRVEPDSAAARAGVQPGDVITRFDGKDIADSGALSVDVGMSAPGKTVPLQVWRDGKAVDLKATLDNASKDGATLASASGEEHGKLGLSVRPLTRDERAQAGVPSGLLVERASGPAADAGIEPGDVVLSADGKPLDSVEELRNIAARHKDVIALLVQRGDSRIFVPVQLG